MIQTAFSASVRLTALTLITLLASSLAYAGEDECQITLSSTEVNYARIQRESIVSSQQNWHKLEEREVNVNIYCPEKQRVAVLLNGSAGEKGRFKFGDQGGVGVKVGNMIVDGKSYTVGKTTDQVNFSPASGTANPLYIHNNEAVIAVENNEVPLGQQVSFTVTLFPVLKDSAFSNISDQTTLESDITWRLLTKS
ncbi:MULTISPECIES: hypothetical protein [Citrobacter]|uniref:hypothetical protein n=1 Tax=Citrobacter TaxID=544 RepID=UPI000947534B|nr:MULTISPECIES: hypothetical protein [Citrobacter]APR33554.1 hypothetical protein BTW28_22540 [Citrobacter freundii]ARC40103.1 hypothetical protein A6J81_04835 [Citrobacter braakii]MBJ8869186.1 hypothetical protein [Citrobacter braakii]MBJ8900446.1 hypothetical protein [Citrobacter braakii]MBJ8905101.1 hypothetical protein [Citrobacter braakii]